MRWRQMPRQMRSPLQMRSRARDAPPQQQASETERRVLNPELKLGSPHCHQPSFVCLAWNTTPEVGAAQNCV